MTECDEVAGNMAIENIVTLADATREVTRQMGTPSEVGYTIHDNVSWALYKRACAARNNTKDRAMNTDLYNTYRHFRMTTHDDARISPAHAALAAARKGLSKGYAYRVETPWKPVLSGVMGKRRWFAETAPAGFRWVGWADDLDRSIHHKGWFLSDDPIMGEVYRGAVWRLPHGRLVAGFVDTRNDGACIELDTAEDERTAAGWGDRTAEMMAEEECDYQRVASARFEHDELGEELAEHRRSFLALRKASKAQRRAELEEHNTDWTIPVWEAVDEAIASHAKDWAGLKVKRAKMRDDYSHLTGWAD